MRLLFACGHVQNVDPDKSPSPICVACGCKNVARALSVGAPRISGHARGPLVSTKFLGPLAISVAEQGPLSLKDSTDA